jgi:replication factor A1
MATEKPEKVIAKISEKTGKTTEEINELIRAKKNKFSGLLTEFGAACLIAKEHGIELENEPKKNIKIAELKAGMNNVDIICKIKTIFPAKEFEKNGKKRKLQNMIIEDDTGETLATLWNGDIEKLENLNVIKGEKIKISNCYVSEYNNKTQISLNYNSTISKEENTDMEKQFKKLKELEPGMQSIDIKAEVRKIFNIRNFDTPKAKGKLITFILGDEETEIRATAWNEKAEEMTKILEDETIIIENAYTKQGMNGNTEINLGKNARIIRQKKNQN